MPKNILINGLLINYHTSSNWIQEKPCVLLLHGRGDTYRTRDLLKEHIPDTYRCIAIDFPGFGSSQQPKTARHIVDYSNFLQQLCITLQIPKESVAIGHSFGCRVLARHSIDNPTYFPDQYWIGAGGIQENQISIYTSIIKIGKKILTAIGLTGLISQIQKHIRSEDFQEAGTMSDIFLNTIHEDLQYLYPQITNKISLIRGSDDKAVPVSHGEIMHSLIKNSELHILKNATHFVHQEKFNQVAEIVLNT